MSSITCVICGARKGGTNDWWVLFEAESGRAVWIGRIEEAETEQPWKPATVPFHLCGVECLYRKLNALLLPSVSGSANGEKPSVLLEPGAGNLRVDPAGSGHGDPACRLIAPSPLRGILHIGRDHKRSRPDPGVRAHDALTAPNGKIGSPKLRENAAIGQGVTINGLIQSEEPLSVNGELTGTLLLPYHRLMVGPNGKIRANVQAREVEVFGVIEGSVRADKIIVRRNARLVGDIWTVTLVIEEGAFFEGTSTKAPGAETGRQERVRHAAYT
jgi:cytoskeletal protein CcmA (bactofilin family)